MVFQDFDLIQERRRLERQRKFRKRVGIAVVTTCVVIGLVAAGIFVIVSTKNKEQQGTSANNKAHQAPSTKQVSRSEKLINTICNGTSYKESCESTLKKAVKEHPNTAQPKDLLKSSISATADELEKAFTKASSFQFNSPGEKQAFNVCKEVMANAKEELATAIGKVGDKDTGKLLSSGELNNWLSAVMSYQETCIDSFADGKLKTDIKSTLNSSQELTSNSLAMARQLSSYVSSVMEMPAASRHLLESTSPSVDKDGLPNWLNHDERRLLKGADVEKPTPNVTVAKDGSGNFSTISEALAAMPQKYDGRYVIYVKAGIYEETVLVTKKMVNLTIYGDGSQKTIVTGNKNYVDGVPTYLTATFVASGDGFLAKAMGFRNTAGPEKHQAVAARVDADRAIFLNCRFEGYQDTLYVQTHRQFYRSCVVAGTIDFIFGDAAAVFQNCLIYVRKPMDNQKNIVTAQGRKDKFETTGIVLQNCKILPDDSFTSFKSQFKSYLGRPWKEYSRTIVMESLIEDLIDPAGWLEWEGNFALNTLYYAEYNNNGPGAKTDARVKWPGRKVINKDEAMKFTVETFLQGTWIKATGAPVRMGLGN
ncbi:PREDICTED: putative pectinesterase/pectinesterase inhibitor 45 [Theobroma cacao]|uniref:Pectinesterase n=1 Tax=Theobroma cacao TaxID=3641 RepID=A0AB32UP34_THECC|nr:PREDICTED: putative pectinesterase/pectinesterase inhibitor 45 [Theobroma cacao]